ncbi:MAG: hypothetical protein OCU22_03730 [Canidatus Methanoxibalbensis ujae]|nr:hypothetical protein [Candidatus Methanoxibalbensis ujae]
MLTKVTKARKETVCYRCGRIIQVGEKYIKVMSPFQRSLGMEAICWDCASPEERETPEER